MKLICLFEATYNISKTTSISGNIPKVDTVGNWEFTDDIENWVFKSSNTKFNEAAKQATKAFCQQKNTKFARLKLR